MAPSSDYTTAGGGLRLKGSKPSGVEKKKSKHKKSKPADATESQDDGKSTAVEKLDADAPAAGGNKTEAERRHEEARRKRMNERIKKEGNKTHKERVEELNRYLSGLSEHHDMPRIGPG